MVNVFDAMKIAGFIADMKSRNFSTYGQWIGITLVFLCIALGISNLFHVNAVIAFGIIAIVQGVILAFVEIPVLLKIFRVPDWFVNIIQKLDNNWMRVAFYALMAVIQWLSIIPMVTSLICLAILFTINALFYGIAGLTHQEFHDSKVVSSYDNNETPADAQIRDVI
ncbi:hypothetical protein B5S28_g2919 [[Candida] boidinii]|nr:hypothetical protein B5S28_g2919 [[Candida] boidinii]OWB61261.1 hypothetical protein B5S29_g2149 [[Candida] boidinii]OWB75282.1 hypothetical protein B5S31_g5159 [[Candida] boidinii]OWB78375.1 hypothetical protein B5S32_g2568 [[Candida] boidinii]GMF71202.1 unnamed protein product [[Candida] boidinii]